MNKCAITNKECKHAPDDNVPLHLRCEHSIKPDDCPIMTGKNPTEAQEIRENRK